MGFASWCQANKLWEPETVRLENEHPEQRKEQGNNNICGPRWLQKNALYPLLRSLADVQNNVKRAERRPIETHK